MHRTMPVTMGTLLGGRVQYAQAQDGYRTGLEPVLLAAAVPARAGDRVLEAGTGAGAAALCLLARVPGARAVALELDPALAELARHNASLNTATLEVHTADVASAARHAPVQHAFANPPWHDPAGTPPANPGRSRAKHLPAGLAHWTAPLAACLAPGGSLTLILPATLVPAAMALLLEAGLGRITLVPLWPRAGTAAKLALLQAWRRKGPARITPGLVLHEGNAFTAAVNAILREGQPLPL